MRKAKPSRRPSHGSNEAANARLTGLALVTGGGGDLGRAIALALGTAGARVVVADVDETKAQSVAEELSATGVLCYPLALDVGSDASVTAAFESIVAQYGRVDILINNAGKAARMPSVDLPIELWNDILTVNLTGTFLCSRAAARRMIPARRGAIVNIASIMGLVGNSLYANPAYHASKGGILSLTRAQAVEWAPYGIRVNAIAPAFADTHLTGKLLTQPGMRSGIIGRTPMGRLADAGEIAAAVVFLASDDASYITGTTLTVDGGWTAI